MRKALFLIYTMYAGTAVSIRLPRILTNRDLRFLFLQPPSETFLLLAVTAEC
jgi:hypothetical protein